MKRNRVTAIFWIIACIGWGWLLYHAFFAAPAMSEGTAGLLRLHVIASGDSAREQAAKLMVRDAVISALSDTLEEADDAEEAKSLVLAREADVIGAARRVLAEAGEADAVRMEVGRFAFPLKQYGDLVVPAGEYEAVRIIIGEGKGQNWWCVLFPPLCMVDAAVAVSTQEANREGDTEKRIVYRSKAAELLGR